MNLWKILTSFTFRYMAIYVLALSMAVFLVMAVIYGIFTYSYFEDLQESIVEELETLTLIYEGQGVAGVNQYIQDQRSVAAGRFHYLLADDDYNKLAGTLEKWPDFKEFGDGWVSFGLAVTDFGGAGPESELLARPVELEDGGNLLVALRYNDIVESARLVFRTLLRTMLATVILGVIGGFFACSRRLILSG